MISSRQNPLVKELCSLTEKKKRRELSAFRFDGGKLLGEAIDARIELLYIVLREDAAQEYSALAARAEKCGIIENDNIICVTAEVFAKLSEEKAPEGVITVARISERFCASMSACELARTLGDGERILLAESLRDPGNLGTVMRSCAALGIDRLILSDDCADLYSSRTVRAAMGALFRQRTVLVPREELAQAIRLLRQSGRRIYAAALHRDALTVGSFALGRGDGFVIGNEGHGLSDGTVEACTACAVIPMAEGSESLNAAAAAAICIWETVRATDR